VKIEGVDNTEAAKYVSHAHECSYRISLGNDIVDIDSFYLGKKIAFVHKAPKEIRMLNIHPSLRDTPRLQDSRVGILLTQLIYRWHPDSGGR
jgi:hypothetical protein